MLKEWDLKEQCVETEGRRRTMNVQVQQRRRVAGVEEEESSRNMMSSVKC
jgi:hypothetical protein